jgi:hypothetical protein
MTATAQADSLEIYRMSFKDPSFQDRVASAAEAKKKALEGLRSKPPVDEKALAERTAKREAREAAAAEKRAARLAAQAEAKAAKIAAAEEAALAAAPKKARAVSLPTEAERKAARDARYAARKSRK